MRLFACFGWGSRPVSPVLELPVDKSREPSIPPLGRLSTESSILRTSDRSSPPTLSDRSSPPTLSDKSSPTTASGSSLSLAPRTPQILKPRNRTLAPIPLSVFERTIFHLKLIEDPRINFLLFNYRPGDTRELPWRYVSVLSENEEDEAAFFNSLKNAAEWYFKNPQSPASKFVFDTLFTAYCDVLVERQKSNSSSPLLTASYYETQVQVLQDRLVPQLRDGRALTPREIENHAHTYKYGRGIIIRALQKAENYISDRSNSLENRMLASKIHYALRVILTEIGTVRSDEDFSPL